MSESQDIREMQKRLEDQQRAIDENAHGLRNARQVLDIKLGQISKDVTELKNALKWAGGLIISLMISFMGWAALQQYNANEQQKTDLQSQVNLLKSQDKAAQDRNAILEELRTGAATATTRDEAQIARDKKSDDLPDANSR